jgi:hypothetical protein
MKVLNLCCANGHGFEGWFASMDDFQSQAERQLVACPLCDNLAITRLPSAPRLNLSGARAPDKAPQVREAGAGPGAPAVPASPSPLAVSSTDDHPMVDLHARWMKAVQQVMRETEDVGERFPEEARRIHYGESAQRGIRGQATPEQRAELADEGIEVLALPVPAALKGPLQ